MDEFYNNATCIPNPAKDFVIFEWELSDTEKPTYINIHNSKGQHIENYKIENRIGVLEIVTSEYANGVYYFELISDNQILKKGKFIILH